MKKVSNKKAIRSKFVLAALAAAMVMVGAVGNAAAQTSQKPETMEAKPNKVAQKAIEDIDTPVAAVQAGGKGAPARLPAPELMPDSGVQSDDPLWQTRCSWSH